MTRSAFPQPTERLRFRTWTSEDVALALSLWGDPEVMRYLDARGALDRDAVTARLRREIRTESEHGVQYWPIFLRATDAFAGCAGLRPRRAGEGVYEIGVHLRRVFWGRGLAREAGEAVVGHAFGLLGATVLFAGHHPDNRASRRLLESVGFRFTHEELYGPTGRMHPSYELRRGDLAGDAG